MKNDIISTPIKKVYWSVPIEISMSKIIKKGISKKRLRKALLTKIWWSIKNYFTEPYIIDQVEKNIYDHYLEPKENGSLGVAIPPKLKHNEVLVTEVILALHKTIPDYNEEKL